MSLDRERKRSTGFARLALGILLPAALWFTAVLARDRMLSPWCLRDPAACRPEALNALDRAALRGRSDAANIGSYVTQYLAGGVGLAAFALSGAPWAPALVEWTTAVVWNGAVTEGSHLVARPRPFVYLDPPEHGPNPSNYTSFYSGHTSFAAASVLAGLLALRRAGRRRSWLTALGLFLVVATGALRVLAGVHFVTDALGGAAAGSLVALLACWASAKGSS